MKRIAILAAFALVARIGVAMADPCSGSNCVIDEPTVTTPPQGTPCNGSEGCARPEPVPPLRYHRADRDDAPAGHPVRQHRGAD